MFTAGCPYDIPIRKHHLVRCFPHLLGFSEGIPPKNNTCPIASPVMVDRLLGKSNQITKQKSIALSCYIMLYHHSYSWLPVISPIANEIRPNSSLSLQTWQEARVEGRRGQGSEVHIASADRGGEESSGQHVHGCWTCSFQCSMCQLSIWNTIWTSICNGQMLILIQDTLV